jgi:hypothetical protein
MKKLILVCLVFLGACTDTNPTSKIVSQSSDGSFKAIVIGTIEGINIYKLTIDGQEYIFTPSSHGSLTPVNNGTR